MATATNQTINPYEIARQSAEQYQQLQGVQDVMGQLGEQMAAAAQGPQVVNQQGQTATELLQERQAELKKQQALRDVAVATNWDELKITLGQDISQLAAQSREISAKIAKDSSVSLFDDPLLAIANAFTLPWDQQNLNAVNQQLEVTSKLSSAAHAHVTQAAAVEDKIKQTVTAESLAETATALANLQKMTELQTRFKAEELRSKTIVGALTANRQQLDIYHTVKTEERAEKQFQLAQARESRLVEMAKLQLQEVKDAKAAEAKHLEYVNLALFSEGKAPITDIVTFKTYKQSAGKMLEELTTRGMKVAINGFEGATQGNTIEERLKWQDAIGWKPQTPQQEKVMVMQEKARKAAVEAAGGKSMMGATAATGDAAFKKQFFEAQKDPITEGSPFEAPSYAVYEAAPNHISNSPIWREYVVAGMKEEDKKRAVNPQQIADAVKRAMLDGKISSSEAAAFSADVFRRAAAVNNEVHQFSKITGGYKQENYGASIKVPSVQLGNMLVESVPPAGAVGIIARALPTQRLDNFTQRRKSINAMDPVAWQNIYASMLSGYDKPAEVKVNTQALFGVGSEALAPAISVR